MRFDLFHLNPEPNAMLNLEFISYLQSYLYAEALVIRKGSTDFTLVRKKSSQNINSTTKKQKAIFSASKTKEKVIIK